MVEINNQRKAFLDMLAWSGGHCRTSENQKSWLWRHCRRRAIYWLLRSPSQTCHAKPKTQIRHRTLPASFPLVGCLPQAAWPEETTLRKVRRCGITAIKERGGFTYDWSWWYPSGNRPLQQYLGFTAGRWLWSVRARQRLTAWLQNSKKRAERSERLMYEQDTAIISALVICIIVCLSWAVNHYRDNAITYKAQRDKNARELKLANALIMTCRCVSVMLLRSMQIHEGLADAKAENDALRDDVAAGRRRLHIKAVCQSVREATTASGVDNAASPPTEHRWTGLFHPQKRGWSLCKNNWKEPRSILMSSADRVAHIDGQLMQLLWAIHTRFQPGINA